MELEDFLSPVSQELFTDAEYAANMFGKTFQIYSDSSTFPNLKKTQIAIVGVNEDRNSVINFGCAEAPDQVRRFLYRLFKGNYAVNVSDLGNIKAGFEIEDTYFALKTVVHELLKKNIVTIVIGGSEDLNFPVYQAFENVEPTINIAGVDSEIDLGEPEEELNSKSWLGKIILQHPNHLFNYSIAGYQTYLVNPDRIQLMDKLFFDTHRLGVVRNNLENAEPVLRNADLVSFDISSVKFTDAPGTASSSPNGFYSDEICQLARYAGMSDKLSVAGFYEVNPKLDRRGQTSSLLAQMIWCFIDGFCSRKKDFPFKKTTDYTKYIVSISDLKSDIVFYKSKKSDRWWLEVPYPSDKSVKFNRHLLVPCSYSTYSTAVDDELPDEWWKTYQKLSF